MILQYQIAASCLITLYVLEVEEDYGDTDTCPDERDRAFSPWKVVRKVLKKCHTCDRYLNSQHVVSKYVNKFLL